MAIFLSIIGFVMIVMFLFGSQFWGWFLSITFLALGILYFLMGRVYSLLKEINHKLDKLTEDK